MCIWCFCGDLQYLQLINNKRDTCSPRLGASLRSRLRVSLRSLATPWLASPWGFASSLATPSQAPLSVGLRCVASLRRSGLHFLFVLYRWLRGYAAPPPATVFRPYGAQILASLELAITPSNSDLSRCFPHTQNPRSLVRGHTSTQCMPSWRLHQPTGSRCPSRVRRR